jgi:hypothetical protein
MWWFILAAFSLCMLGYYLFNVITIFNTIALVLDFLGRPTLLMITAAIGLIIWGPMFFLILGIGIDSVWSIKCISGDQDACTYNTVFFPALHPGTPNLWEFSTITVRNDSPIIVRQLSRPNVPTYSPPVIRETGVPNSGKQVDQIGHAGRQQLSLEQVRRLIVAVDDLTDRARDADSDQEHTELSNNRDMVIQKLNQLGWCLGHDEQSNAERRWELCQQAKS